MSQTEASRLVGSAASSACTGTISGRTCYMRGEVRRLATVSCNSPHGRPKTAGRFGSRAFPVLPCPLLPRRLEHISAVQSHAHHVAANPRSARVPGSSPAPRPGRSYLDHRPTVVSPPARVTTRQEAAVSAPMSLAFRRIGRGSNRPFTATGSRPQAGRRFWQSIRSLVFVRSGHGREGARTSQLVMSFVVNLAQASEPKTATYAAAKPTPRPTPSNDSGSRNKSPKASHSRWISHG